MHTRIPAAGHITFSVRYVLENDWYRPPRGCAGPWRRPRRVAGQPSAGPGRRPRRVACRPPLDAAGRPRRVAGQPSLRLGRPCREPGGMFGKPYSRGEPCPVAHGNPHVLDCANIFGFTNDGTHATSPLPAFGRDSPSPAGRCGTAPIFVALERLRRFFGGVPSLKFKSSRHFLCRASNSF